MGRARSPLLHAYLLACAVGVGCDNASGVDYGDPTTMTKVTGDEASANTGDEVTPSPSVRITDAQGRPVPGIEVSFTVGLGGGLVSGSNAETNTLGIASVGSWTLGTLGMNSLHATSPDLTSITFSATSLCPSIGTLSLGGQASGALATGDCLYGDGFLTDRYAFTVPAARVVRFTQRSSVLNSYIEIVSGGRAVAADNNVGPGVLDASIRVLLPAGSYQVGAGAFRPEERGAYTLSAEEATSNMTGSDVIYTVRGVTTQQTLDPTDHPSPTTPAFYSEAFLIRLEAGETYTFAMSSAAFDAYLLLLSEGPSELELVAWDDDSGDGSNARLVHTPTLSGFYVLFASSALPAMTGAYTLTVQ